GAIVFGGILAPVLLLAALRLTLAGSVSLLLNLELVATAVLGVVFFRESLGRLGWLGVTGVVSAGVLIASDSGWPRVWAAALTAGACLCWGAANNLTALIDGMTPARSTFWKGLLAGIVNTALGGVTSHFSATVTVLAAALAVGVLSYGVSIMLHTRAAQE